MQYYVVDAFTDSLFHGNPAGVCLLDGWPDDALMQNIAMENNLAETAFLVRREDGFGLRWFTPGTEIDLCGHATLAAAFVVANFVDKEAIEMAFHTMSGILTVRREGDLYEMDFPARKPEPISITPLMESAIGATVCEAHLSRDMVLLVENEAAVLALQPNMELISQLPGCFALIVTAKGDTVDFVSRFFAPNAAIPEDPVTGSAHSTLIPFWAERLGKTEMTARQLSKRGGTLYCADHGERVKIGGRAVLYLKGEICIG